MAFIPKKTRKYNTKKRNRSTIKLNRIHLKNNWKGGAGAGTGTGTGAVTGAVTGPQPNGYNMNDLIKKYNIKGIIFDKDGTLINSEEWLRKSINLALQDIIKNENKEIIKFIIEGKDAFVQAQGAGAHAKGAEGAGADADAEGAEGAGADAEGAEGAGADADAELYTVENHMDTISMSNFHNFDENLKQLLEKHNLLNPNTSKDYKEDYIKFFKTKYRDYQDVLKDKNFLKLTSPKLSELIETIKSNKIQLAINSSGTYDKYQDNLVVEPIKELFSQFDFVLLEMELIDHGNRKTEYEHKDKKITIIKDIKKKPNPDTYTFIAQSLFDISENDMETIMVVEDTAKGALAAIRANVGLIIINTNGELDLVQRKFLEYNTDINTSNDIKYYIKKGKLIFVDNLDTLIGNAKKD